MDFSRRPRLSKSRKPRPHACIACSKLFVRREHLQRHVRTHTKEKPFQCPDCRRSFGRRDIMCRHRQKLHRVLSKSTDASQDSVPHNIGSGESTTGGKEKPYRSKDPGIVHVGMMKSTSTRPMPSSPLETKDRFCKDTRTSITNIFDRSIPIALRFDAPFSGQDIPACQINIWDPPDLCGPYHLAACDHDAGRMYQSRSAVYPLLIDTVDRSRSDLGTTELYPGYIQSDCFRSSSNYELGSSRPQCAPVVNNFDGRDTLPICIDHLGQY